MDFKLPRQLRLAGLVVQIAGLIWNPMLIWLGLFIIFFSYSWSVGIIEDYFIALGKLAEEKKENEETQSEEEKENE